MLAHRDIAGLCAGKLILQNKRAPKKHQHYMCNVCDVIISVKLAEALKRRKRTHQRRVNRETE